MTAAYIPRGAGLLALYVSQVYRRTVSVPAILRMMMPWKSALAHTLCRARYYCYMLYGVGVGHPQRRGAQSNEADCGDKGRHDWRYLLGSVQPSLDYYARLLRSVTFICSHEWSCAFRELFCRNKLSLANTSLLTHNTRLHKRIWGYGYVY